MHGNQGTATCSLIFLFAFLLFTNSASASPPDIFPVEPSANQVFNSTNNITFTCNATDEGQILNLALYHNLNGTFSANQTQNYGENPYDSNTTFLCHFSGGLTCQGGGSGTPASNQSLSFQQGKFSQGVMVNETGILRYQTLGNFDRNKGTIEFWMRPGSSMGTETFFIFHAADSDSQGANEHSIYVSSGTLYFEVYDFSGLNSWAYMDVLWQAGEWYHIAATWDIYGDTGRGNPLDLFVNGSNEESYFEGDPEIPCISTPSLFSIGSDKANSSQINATIDDFRISSTIRSASEINQSYYNGLGNYSSVSKSWAFQGVPDGSYIWKCLAYDNDSQSNQSSQRSFYVDMSTQPAVNGIFLSPNSMDDIDPGVTINVTANITDPSGVSAVIFQWKKVGDWNNITMSYNASSGLYGGASFQTGMVSGVYLCRIWSNDTKGSSGYSATQNVTSAWDFTWSRSPVTFGTVSGPIDLVSNIGILTINNTGDDTLNFTLSNNWPLTLPVYYNGSEDSNFYMENHTSITLNITARFASSDIENVMLINISASHPTETPSPLSLTTNATINSYTGGPYLSVTIMEYTSMVSQSQSFNLSAKVKNIGNETAEDAWLNWSIPAGWSNISGNITYFAGNISSGSFVWNNLAVLINPSSASPGTFIIYANSSCSQNVTGYDSKTVGVACSNSDGVCGHGCSYVNDNDCGIPAGGGPGAAEPVFIGGGGRDSGSQYSMAIESEAKIDLNRGDKKSVEMKITNTGKRTMLSEISLLVSGYSLTQVKIMPSSIARLQFNQTATLDLEFSAPAYMKYGIYNVTVTARGTGSSNETRNLTIVEKSSRISIAVHSMQENETKGMVGKAEYAISEMKGLGISTGAVSSLLEKAKAQISEWDYDTANENLENLLEIRGRALRIFNLINQVAERIREAEGYGMRTPESRAMAELSKSALAREDYAKAEERANNALVAYVIESRGIDAVKFICAYWWLVLALSAVSVLGAYSGYRKTLRSRIRKKSDALSEEEKAVRKLMEKCRDDYYKERVISRHDFHSQMAEHEARLAKIRQRKSGLAVKMAGLEKRPAETLRKQQDSIRKEIQDAQRKYFEQGAIAKSSYQKTVQELREELAESLRNIEMVESRKKGQALFSMAALFLVFALLAQFALAQSDEKQAAIVSMEKADFWISEMKGLGFPVNRANDTLNEAKLLFSKGFYKGAEAVAKDVENIKNTAISLDRELDETEKCLFDVSLETDASPARAIFEDGLKALKAEQYEKAQELLDQTRSKLEEIESEAAMKRAMNAGALEGIISFIKENALAIAACSAAAMAAALIGLKQRKKRGIRKKKSDLEKGRESIARSMKDAQARYFGQGRMSKAEYETAMSGCRKKLNRIKREMLVLEAASRKQEAKR